MSTTIGASASLLLNYTRSGQAVLDAQPSLAQLLSEDATTGSQLPASATVALSDEAKAYLARTSAATAADSGMTLATRAANARQWFDQQYQALGISSALIDGKVAVDLSGQGRATLSAVASNAQGLFSRDESAAAATALQSRFDTAISPHVVIARHTGNYAALYDAALKYADEAGSDERATVAWQDQKQALLDGAAAARKTPGKAPDTGSANDPVKALLGKTTPSGSLTPQMTIAAVAANARLLLDDQANSAQDKGTELVFDASRKDGQQVDFAKFDNRSLAAVALNQGAAFSPGEVRAAKAELDQRNRASVLDTLKATSGSSDGTSASLALVNRYAAMSTEEKAALGISDDFTKQLVQTYQSIQATQGRLGGNSSLGLVGYL
ncbi:hypothetical protein [Bosea vaviloviae]|uniref:Uncharacterized protein n=1 Tax=Bosea vaviloviae TaxID=1526658 RepID=A0A1D7U8W4_9HYPH|nr:hypothetical protein [Bosea vaviloviae]AOO83826.1 hypothetical protein BHK69_28300 [Bosea vaviloviae]